MVVLSNARDGREDEFNRWYDEHIRDTIEVEDDRLARAYEQFLYGRQERAEALAAGRAPLVWVSDSLDPEKFLVGFYSAITDQVPSRRLAGTRPASGA